MSALRSMSSRVSSGVAGEIARPHGGEIERLPRGGDVVRHVRRFGRLLVGRDDEALNRRRVERPADRSQEVQADRERHGPHGRGKRVIGRERRADSTATTISTRSAGIRAMTSV